MRRGGESDGTDVTGGKKKKNFFVGLFRSFAILSLPSTPLSLSFCLIRADEEVEQTEQKLF